MRTSAFLLFALAACGSPQTTDSPADAASTPTPTPTSSPTTTNDASVPKPETRLGANVVDGGVTFRVWAPNATAAAVSGDFDDQKVAMNAEPGGLFAVTVKTAHAGSTYRFLFESPSGAITRLDPYCREVLADGSSCKVIDPRAYAWKSKPFTRAPRSSTIVYEMHVGSFDVGQGEPSGTFTRARLRLPELADLGVDVIELMPVQSFGGKANAWGYNPQLYFAPKAGYGTADELRAFVDDAHALGIGVFIDAVINHYDGWNQAPLACFDGACNQSRGIYFFAPGPYASTPWGPRPDYTSPRVAEMLKASAAAWLSEFRGDGFRWDSVSNIRALDGNGDTPGGRALLTQLNDLTHAAGAMSVAEDLKGWDAITKPTSGGGFGFDAQWDGFGYDVPNVLVPPSDDGRDLGVIENALRGGYAGDPFARLLFIENHDTVGNGGARLPSRIDGANPESFAARRRAMLGATLLFTTPGVPMLFMGQESLARGTFTGAPAPLAQSLPAGGAKMRAFYKDLIALRRDRDGKSGGLADTGVEILHRNDANKVIAYRRHGASGEDVIVVVNLRNKAYTRYDVGVPAGGDYRIRIDDDWAAYGDDFGGGQTGTVSALAAPKDGKPFTLPVRLGAYGAVVFSR